MSTEPRAVDPQGSARWEPARLESAPLQMNAPATSTTDPHDQWVEHPRGRLFTRTWAPADLSEAQRLANPIVLFHDSLGCVALWRDFPARLSRAARRRVIAYDRLGYGRSGPRTDRPSLRFVSEEAEVYFPVLRELLGVQGFVAFGTASAAGWPSIARPRSRPIASR